MNKRIRTGLFIALLAAILGGCSKEEPIPSQEPVDETPVPGQYRLPVIETTDIHGHVVDKEGETVHYRMAFISDKVKDIRGYGDAYDKDRLLLLDGGDLYQGASVSNLLDGWPVFAAMDRMDYDAVALGNHEFDWGIETTVDADATMPDYEWNGENFVNEVPVVCANLFRNGSRDPRTRDYVVVEKKAVHTSGKTIPVRIGVIGFAVDYAGSIMASKFTNLGYTIRENYAIANGIAAELESSGQCDATVLLIHGSADAAASRLGSDSVIDLVLGGHSHVTMYGRTATGISYLQGGRYGQHYASGSLVFTLAEDAETLSFAGTDNLKVSAVSDRGDQHTYDGQNEMNLDADILAVSDAALEATADQNGDAIGYITVNATTYSISGSGDRASVMSNWMCDILRRIGGADVAFVNGGGIRTYFPLDGQGRRDITVSDVYEMFPFGNTTFVYDLSYAELLRVFEYALTSGGGSLFTGMTGIDCHFSGGDVTALVKDGTAIYMDGKWVGDWASQRVTLAVSEYLATSERTDYYTGLANPLLEWNKTDRLLSNGLVDNENAVLVLREEAAASGGHLYIDTEPHFILAN